MVLDPRSIPETGPVAAAWAVGRGVPLGYVQAALVGAPRVEDPAFRDFARRELWTRTMALPLRPFARSSVIAASRSGPIPPRTPARQMADLGIIIVSFNSASYLSACLSSLYAHADGAELDVVVVDNGSTDGSAELVEREFPRVRVRRNENRGFAHGNNRGFEITDASYVLFVNPDVEIREGSFAELLRLLDRRPTVGLVGSSSARRRRRLFPTTRRFPTPTRLLMQAMGSERLPFRSAWCGERELDPIAYDRETGCDWVTGSFMLARREAVLQAGMMDERYFLFSEETDFCAAIHAAGWEVRYLPDMTILHYFEKNGYNARLLAQEAYARRQYMLKHDGQVRRALSTAALALGYGRRAVSGSLAARRHGCAASRRAPRCGRSWESPRLLSGSYPDHCAPGVERRVLPVGSWRSSPDPCPDAAPTRSASRSAGKTTRTAIGAGPAAD